MWISITFQHERLKQHLLHIEEEYTAELVKAEQNLQETQSKLRDAEDRVKSSASAYTSASVRTNQQVRTTDYLFELKFSYIFVISFVVSQQYSSSK